MKSFLWFLCWGIFSFCLHLEPRSRRCLLALDFVLRYQLCSSAQSGFVSHLQIYISEHSHVVCAPQEPAPPLKVPAHGSIDQLYFFWDYYVFCGVLVLSLTLRCWSGMLNVLATGMAAGLMTVSQEMQRKWDGHQQIACKYVPSQALRKLL